jgi:hypothetical protein
MKRREFLKSAALSVAASVAVHPRRALAQGPVEQAPVEPDVKLVLITFMCHLDIGFTDTQANVMQTYFKKYYPQAMEITAKQREEGGNRYVWTTASWLLYEYLEQASPEQRRQMEQSIRAGDLAWHALPFNWQTEMLDRSMIEGCMGFSKTLDSRFGRKTTGGKMTDVPGHSRGLVPLLAAADVSFLDVGVNPASTPPDVPDVFLWKDPDGSSLAVLYHRHAYGGTVRVPGSELAISVNMRVDNTGPHTADEINGIYSDLKRRFPNAQLKAGSFTDIAMAVEPLRSTLPVVTQEIGDTWIYGAASDPVKIARYREVARLRTEWIAANKLSLGDAIDQQLLRRLALAPEHTWGTDTKRYIDHEHYSPKELAEYIDKPNYQIMVRSWQEKRDDIDEGVANLPPSLRAEADIRLQSLKVVEPDHSGMKLCDGKSMIRTTHYDLALDPDTGCIRSLVNRHSRYIWASKENPLALFTYQTLTQDDYKAFLNAYVVSKAWWAPQDFGKPNIGRLHPQSRDWHPILDAIWISDNAEHHRVLAQFVIDDPVNEQLGLVAWPKRMYLDLIFPRARPVVEMTFYALGKAPNRMPEAMWLTFRPQTSAAANWTLEKVNQDVSPLDVVAGGGRRMHAVTARFSVRDGDHQLEITTLDAPVVALGVRSPLNFSMDLPDLQQGAHVSLFNNAWGTNYPQWAGGDWMYRFTLSG